MTKMTLSEKELNEIIKESILKEIFNADNPFDRSFMKYGTSTGEKAWCNANNIKGNSPNKPKTNINSQISNGINEEFEEEGIGQFLKSVGKGAQAGWNGFKNAEMVDNTNSLYNKDLWRPGMEMERENFIQNLIAQEYKLQKQLNQLRAKRKALEKQYNTRAIKPGITNVTANDMKATPGNFDFNQKGVQPQQKFQKPASNANNIANRGGNSNPNFTSFRRNQNRSFLNGR